MSVIYKKTLILKPIKNVGTHTTPLSGMIKLEFFGDKVNGKLHILNAEDDNLGFTLVFSDEKNNIQRFDDVPFKFDFSLNGYTAENICAFIFLNDDYENPILCGRFSTDTLKLKNNLDYVRNALRLPTDKTQLLKEETLKKDSRSVIMRQTEYDDEAIADENYFEKEPLYKKAPLYKLENSEDDDDSYVPDATFRTSTKTQEQTQTSQTRNDYDEIQEYENAFEQERPPTYYSTVKSKIDKLFNEHQPFLPLSQTVPFSKWIKIDYNKNSHYVVGIVFIKNVPSFIVYGVPGLKLNKPNGFLSDSQFIPTDLFSSSQNGYWCTFQSAQSGEIISQQEHC